MGLVDSLREDCTCNRHKLAETDFSFHAVIRPK